MTWEELRPPNVSCGGIAKATKDEATKMSLAAELLRPQRMRQAKDRL